ncbi:unnamed protein product [Trichogramma brassicae]|uniref:Uncharacterized protein n=1 Tax=Trichogramma brassicae TaxID=86971 RepID=A0A6H5INZ9_9HYME|nr:unnamed protein product [Trichogramma brassicae]
MNARREIPTNHEARRSYSSTNEIATPQHSAELNENRAVTLEAIVILEANIGLDLVLLSSSHTWIRALTVFFHQHSERPRGPQPSLAAGFRRDYQDRGQDGARPIAHSLLDHGCTTPALNSRVSWRGYLPSDLSPERFASQGNLSKQRRKITRRSSPNTRQPDVTEPTPWLSFLPSKLSFEKLWNHGSKLLH